MKKKSLKEMIEEGILHVGEELEMNYRGLDFIGIVTEDGKIKTSVGTSSVSKSAVDMMNLSGRSKRKQMLANGFEWWKNKMGISLKDLRGEDKNTKQEKSKNLKKMVEEGILKENEEIYLTYKNVEYTGRVTSDGKVKTHLGEFSPSKASAAIALSHPDNQRNHKTASGLKDWKTWNGVSIGDLRKI